MLSIYYYYFQKKYKVASETITWTWQYVHIFATVCWTYVGSVQIMCGLQRSGRLVIRKALCRCTSRPTNSSSRNEKIWLQEASGAFQRWVFLPPSRELKVVWIRHCCHWCCYIFPPWSSQLNNILQCFKNIQNLFEQRKQWNKRIKCVQHG